MANHEQSFLGNVLFPAKREIELPRRNSDSCKYDFSFIIKTLNYSYCCLFYFQLFFFIAGLCHPTHKWRHNSMILSCGQASVRLTHFIPLLQKNTLISPNFLEWKFCRKAQFPLFSSSWKHLKNHRFSIVSRGRERSQPHKMS